MIRKAGVLLLVLSAIVSIFNGCITSGTKKTEWKPEKTVNRPPYIHTVKYSGETLRIISKWYTGDANNWEALADANPNIDYEKLAIDSRIFVPENLLRKTEALTKEFIAAYNQKSKPKVKEKKKKPASVLEPKVKKEKKKPVLKPKPRPKKDEDFDLIGPK